MFENNLPVRTSTLRLQYFSAIKAARIGFALSVERLSSNEDKIHPKVMKTVFAFLVILLVAVSVQGDVNGLSDAEVNELKSAYTDQIESRFEVSGSR